MTNDDGCGFRHVATYCSACPTVRCESAASMVCASWDEMLSAISCIVDFFLGHHSVHSYLYDA